jgi:hypothetical protein
VEWLHKKTEAQCGKLSNFPHWIFKVNLRLQKPYRSCSDMTHVTRITAFDVQFLTLCHVTERVEDRFCFWRSASYQPSGYISATFSWTLFTLATAPIFHTGSQFSYYSLTGWLNFLCQHMWQGPKVPAWYTKAAPNGKCCEGYIAPSMVRLMYQYQAATCSRMLEALVLVVVLYLSP